jgi:hypothetical protein
VKLGGNPDETSLIRTPAQHLLQSGDQLDDATSYRCVAGFMGGNISAERASRHSEIDGPV